MRRKLQVAVTVLAASLCLSGPTVLAAEPAATDSTSESLEVAITRVAELLQRAKLLGEDAARQHAQLEELQAQLAKETREHAAALATRGKDLEYARAQLAAVQKQLGELRAATAPGTAAAQPEVDPQLKAKDAEIAELRAELKRLQERIAKTAAPLPVAAISVPTTAVAPQPPPPPPAAPLPPVVAAAPVAVAAPPTDVAIAPPPDGTAIKKWQKPDGTLFFGERPPAGSKFVGYTTGGGL